MVAVLKAEASASSYVLRKREHKALCSKVEPREDVVEVLEILFSGLMTQSEISQLLDELFGNLKGDSLGEEDTIATLHEEVERESTTKPATVLVA